MLHASLFYVHIMSANSGILCFLQGVTFWEHVNSYWCGLLVYLCWWRRPCNTITLQFGLRQNRAAWQEALPGDCSASSFYTQRKNLRQKTNKQTLRPIPWAPCEAQPSFMIQEKNLWRKSLSVVEYESWCEVSNSLQREGSEMAGYWLVLARDQPRPSRSRKY